MYGVMLIDDDQNVVERMKSIIDWPGLSLEFSCEAGDSETAIEQFLLCRPKIIVTDINIPIINGLELARELLKEDAELRFIVITGYNEFDMVRQSIDIKAVSLLGKPLTRAELNGSLEKAIRQLDELHQAKVSRAALQQLVKSNLPQMQELFLAGLLRKKPKNTALIPAKVAQLCLPLTGPRYIAVVMSVSTAADRMDNRDAVTLLLKSTILDGLSDIGCTAFAFTDAHYRLNCVVNAPDGLSDEQVEDALIKARSHMRYEQDAELFAGIGPTVRGLPDLYVSYSGAIMALNYQSVLGSETITHYKNLERFDTLSEPNPLCGHLVKLFRAGDGEELKRAITGHTAYLTSYRQENERLVNNFFIEYVTAVINEALRMGVDRQNMAGCGDILLRLFQKNSAESSLHDVLELTSTLIDQVAAQRIDNTNHLILLAKRFILDHLNDPGLDLERVSNHIGLSRIYFCKLFRQAEGCNFSAYLKNERVNLAKKLLQTTNMKVFEVSAATGFSSPKYFTFVFKQAVGLAPLEFQSRG